MRIRLLTIAALAIVILPLTAYLDSRDVKLGAIGWAAMILVFSIVPITVERSTTRKR